MKIINEILPDHSEYPNFLAVRTQTLKRLSPKIGKAPGVIADSCVYYCLKGDLSLYYSYIGIYIIRRYSYKGVVAMLFVAVFIVTVVKVGMTDPKSSFLYTICVLVTVLTTLE